MSETLIIYSRYPESGKTKTRMIPVLGKEGAAELQRKMSEHTLNTARKLKSMRQVVIEVHFAGGNKQLMSDWLGKDLEYIPQVSGDLGDRMNWSFQRAFNSDQKRVVTIGIDCPDLDLEILNLAFDSLRSQELAIGVAEDGGYYLIGLNQIVPPLFQNINWGSDRVLAQTKAIAQQLNLNTTYLTTLSDVDRPEDLPIWQKHYYSNFN
ncbi:TIGR04282 family arsenosugar biosynthesis glycosyltransferase [Waterburya agarophytonicola K14]|uniref:TIGR04282 family arsenosugar biosynthesis glycosyltransferase n=1 Tax=Waterburya agarophytonicola KI4 TaxID=2874699 RepID=A0A964FH33_9CYAN|nr:TIGR04282 family arsenosugar biosynthesis glycosyltransferase [Waterburya agarophytonicola]MCC0177239.1 TIGR04282 family arsenosugar biosynthesis glycosyltransferase [Waterburya agarophytonicola KI4]